MNLQRPKVNPVCILRLQEIPSSIGNLTSITTFNEGSHTRLIQYKINSQTRISIVQKNKKKIRYVWLGTYMDDNITFARSLWQTDEKHENKKRHIIRKPIGLSFINNKIDISKKMYELYCFHCKEIKLDARLRPLWGRKYSIQHLNKKEIIVQEFFSKRIIL